MEEIIKTYVNLIAICVFTLIGAIKALIPVGFLPRKNVKDQIVLITGTGSGLGRLMAKEFVNLGSRVVLWDVNEKENLETLEQVKALGGEGYAFTVDLAKKENIYAAADKVKAQIGNVDILINNAGVVTGKKLFDCPDELMELTMAVNCKSLLYTAKSFVPKMLERNRGHVVTVASMAGKIGAAGLVDYCASKHGAVGFHESLTSEIISLKKTGVHTTVVCPIYINTGMFDGVATRSPNLFPILEPQFVVNRIMEAILTNQRNLYLTRFCYVAMFAESFLPSAVTELLFEYFGINETMDTFKGRSKKTN